MDWRRAITPPKSIQRWLRGLRDRMLEELPGLLMELTAEKREELLREAFGYFLGSIEDMPFDKLHNDRLRKLIKAARAAKEQR